MLLDLLKVFERAVGPSRQLLAEHQVHESPAELFGSRFWIPIAEAGHRQRSIHRGGCEHQLDLSPDRHPAVDLDLNRFGFGIGIRREGRVVDFVGTPTG